MGVVEDDKKAGQVMLIAGLHGLMQVGVVGRSNCCQTKNRHLECRGLEFWLSGQREPFPCKVYYKQMGGRLIRDGRNGKRVKRLRCNELATMSYSVQRKNEMKEERQREEGREEFICVLVASTILHAGEMLG